MNVRATCKPALGDADCQPEYMCTRADEAIEYVRGRITWEARPTLHQIGGLLRDVDRV